MRDCGILMHISSLPGKGACGTIGTEARRFVEYLKAAGQSNWQVLPLTPPARGNSPYSSLSVFAGNPYFIDLQALVDENLLPPDATRFLPDGSGSCDFDWCESVHIPLLQESFKYAGERMRRNVTRFREKNIFWLPDYALFMAIRGANGNKPLDMWPEALRFRDDRAMRTARAELAESVAFWEYVQYLFYTQWRALRRFATARGIRLTGDMPIYADRDSADVWANPSVFELDGQLNPERVAGVPPDAFSADGQLWGNPLYNWKRLKWTRYHWWTERMKRAAALFDSVRIDHFRAIANYWAVPAGAASAKSGIWEKGPGMDFIRAITAAAPDCELIAEDLGLLDNNVRELLKKSGLPGMKVLLFAFDSASESDYLPHNFIKNCVGYIGTHDNDTVIGWMKTAPKKDVNFARAYLEIDNLNQAHNRFIRALYATSAEHVIVQMQDVLGLGGEARMNTPGIATGNWTWRLPAMPEPETAKYLHALAGVYKRAAGLSPDAMRSAVL